MRRFGWGLALQRAIGLGSVVVLGLWDLARWVIGLDPVVALGFDLVRRAIERVFGSRGWIERCQRRGPWDLGCWSQVWIGRCRRRGPLRRGRLSQGWLGCWSLEIRSWSLGGMG